MAISAEGVSLPDNYDDRFDSVGERVNVDDGEFLVEVQSATGGTITPIMATKAIAKLVMTNPATLRLFKKLVGWIGGSRPSEPGDGTELLIMWGNLTDDEKRAITHAAYDIEIGMSDEIERQYLLFKIYDALRAYDVKVDVEAVLNLTND